MTNTKLPKQTIERIERESVDYFNESYIAGATREALLVLPVLEAAKLLIKDADERDYGSLAADDLHQAITNYEQGTAKSDE